MNELSIDSINKRAPLPVSTTDNGSFVFSNGGDRFVVGFVKDTAIMDEGVYQFFIESENESNRSGSKKVRMTIIAIIEEFFAANDSAMLYICDTSDNRQSARDRLFAAWFNDYDHNFNYTLSRASIEIDDTLFYAALVVSNKNPRYLEILSAFNSFVEDMGSKLS